MKAAVIGTGYWGPNLIRNFLALDEIEAVAACDLDEVRLAKMRKSFYGIETSNEPESLIDRDDIDVVVIATVGAIVSSVHETSGVVAVF